MHIRDTFLIFTVFCCVGSSALSGADMDNTSESSFVQRAAEIAEWLPDRPKGVGVPASDRATWDRLAADANWREVIPTAEAYLDRPVPKLKDELYLAFTRTGNRDAYQKDYFRLQRQFDALVLAECLENKGRFLALIEQYLDQYIHCRSWVYPAHDGNLESFHGKRQIIDLGASRMAFNLATADYLLGEKLTLKTRRKLHASIFDRVLTPIKQQLMGEHKEEWWFHKTNNWNAVCLANVTGAALALVEDTHERALYIAGAEYYIRNFLDGFNEDGYCTEGPGYWNYGYGRFITLCKLVYKATGGRLDFFDSEKARRPATFGWDIQLLPGVVPAFADCSIRTRPSPLILEYTGRRLNAPKSYRTSRLVSPTQEIFTTLLYDLPGLTDDTDNPPVPTLPIRTWFDKTGVLICRPQNDSACQLAAAFKGGHNAEHHNHNDLGSFVVTVDGGLLLVDPGSEVYTKFTFSNKRYESDANNSYGHAVPVIAGHLQETGASAYATIVESAFTETCDRLTFDLTKAYAVESLQTLRRQFIFSREGEGRVGIIDDVVFSEPNTFETALITYGTVNKPDPQHLLITDGNVSARVKIGAGHEPFSVVIVPLTADFRGGKPTRVGIKLDRPVKRATVTIDITPGEK